MVIIVILQLTQTWQADESFTHHCDSRNLKYSSADPQVVMIILLYLLVVHLPVLAL